MSPSLPFKLGPKAFKFLTDQFLQSNFSLTGFTRGLKVKIICVCVLCVRVCVMCVSVCYMYYGQNLRGKTKDK